MKNEPLEDVVPIEHGDFPLLCLITGPECKSIFVNDKDLGLVVFASARLLILRYTPPLKKET